MSASSVATSPAHLKTANPDRPAVNSQVGSSSASHPKPRRSIRRLLVLCSVGALLVAGVIFWYVNNVGYVTTDDATIEAHVIQVSPKISAHVKTVHFDDNYQVRQGELLVELDSRDYEVSLASADANLASARSKLVEAEAQQNVALAGLGQVKADLASARATADNAESDLNRNEHLFQTHVIDRREYDASVAQAKSAA